MAPTDPLQPKLIYLTRRHPAFSRGDWTARWRQHGALGMSLPRWENVARYVHCDLVDPTPGQRDYLSDHDGVGMIWHRSIAHRDRHFADTTAQQTMVDDEAQTFARPIARDCVSVREELVRGGAETTGAIRLFAFLETAVPLDTPPAALRHVRCHPLPHRGDVAWGLGAKWIEEFWFADIGAADDAARRVHAGGVRCVIGRDAELYRLSGS